MRGNDKLQAAKLKSRLDKDPSDYETLAGLGVVRYFMAVKDLKDSKSYSAIAVQLLEQALQAKPENAELLCYLGSAYLLKAKDEPDLTIQASYASKGLELMDEAVRK